MRARGGPRGCVPLARGPDTREVVNDFPEAGVKSAHPNLRRSVVTDQEEPKLSWLAARRERKRLKRERTGDSPEKLAELTRQQRPR